MTEKLKWTRNHDLDRPKLMLPCQPRDGEMSLPPVVGAFNEAGTPIGISVKLAEQLGWVIPTLCLTTLPIEAWIEKQRKIEENKKKLKDTEWEMGTGRPKW